MGEITTNNIDICRTLIYFKVRLNSLYRGENMSNSVIFRNVTKKYKMYKKTSDKLLDILLPKGYGEDFFALQNISFTASPGDVIGIIGVNGAGKSTLSNLISGIIPPTSGSIETVGETSLIAISSGMNNELTGRENIELKCLLLGYSKKKIKEITPSIIEFADIGNFIDQPVKKYSSGMKSRLGFAISVTIDPDILVIDEALSVGDQTFADKCLDKMNEFKAAGKTIFFISHSIGQVKKFCNKALWLEAGEVKEYGPIKEVMPGYEKFLKEFKAMSKEEQKNFKQLVLEKRSKENKTKQLGQHENLSQEPNQEKVIEPSQDRNKVTEQPSKLHSTDQLMSRTSKLRSKKPSVLPKIILSLCILFILVSAIYVIKDYLVSGIKEDATHKVNGVSQKHSIKGIKQKKVSETEKKEATDTRYVNVKAAYVHENPSLQSTGIGMASFGDAYEILGNQENQEDNIEWLKIHYKDGEEGWISSKIVTKINDRLEDKKVLKFISSDVEQNQNVDNLVNMLGKTKNEIENQGQNENTQFSYDNNDICTEIVLNLNQIEKDSLIVNLGNPQLEIQKEAILYHGKKYDFIFYYSSDTNSVNKLYINKSKDVVSS